MPRWGCPRQRKHSGGVLQCGWRGAAVRRISNGYRRLEPALHAERWAPYYAGTGSYAGLVLVQVARRVYNWVVRTIGYACSRCDKNYRRERALSVLPPAILKSSTLLPALSAETSQRGCLPRPDQVSSGADGFWYLG